MVVQYISVIGHFTHRIRLQEGFLFANASCGIINMIAEVNMVVRFKLLPLRTKLTLLVIRRAFESAQRCTLPKYIHNRDM